MIRDQRLIQYTSMIKGLNEKWTPHVGQVAIGKALFQEKVLEIFAQCGRNFGKTDLLAYLYWRWSQTHPGSDNYYFSPFMKQSREILWASGRIQTFGPRDWIQSINNTEMRITFKNGSFIKLDGSDNVEAYRGVKPRNGLIGYDEFKDFRPEFHEAFDPNRRGQCPLIIIGTPPDRECQFTQLADAFRKDALRRFYQFPTETNPHIPKAWLMAKKAELYARGEGDVWEREYMARFVKGGAAKIFPMLTRDMVKPHNQLMKEISRDARKLIYYLWSDPAAASCFAVLFVAFNPFTKTVYLLDEIYETDQKAMSVKQIGRRIFQIRDELYSRSEWRQGYDEAETWFANEMQDNFDEYFEPSHKAANDKESGLSLIKDIMLEGKLVISERCEKFFWEADNYFKDKNGKIPKKNDHLLDCLRYILAAEGYELKTQKEHFEKEDEDFRGSKISDDFPQYTDDFQINEEYEGLGWENYD